MEFKGQVKGIFKRTYDKRDGTTGESVEVLVEELTSSYPQSAVFEVGRNATMPNENDIVTVYFSMNANVWNDRVFGKNRAWKIEVDKAAPTPEPIEEEDPLSVFDKPAKEEEHAVEEKIKPAKKSKEPVADDEMPF